MKEYLIIIYLEKEPFNTIKLLILHSRHIGFFKGVNPSFCSKKGNFPFVCFWTEQALKKYLMTI